MNEEEIIEQFEHWIEYEKEHKEQINKADKLIEIQQGLLDLYQKEKEKNKSLTKQINLMRSINLPKEIEENYISKDKIKQIIKDLSIPIEDSKRFIGDEQLKDFFLRVKSLLEEE